MVYTLPALVYVSFHSRGWLTYAPVIEAFVLIPLLELFFKPDTKNLNDAEAEMALKDPIYDFMVYLIVPTLYFLAWQFCEAIIQPDLSRFEFIGRLTAMGMAFGTLGINVGHELGHRQRKFERVLSQMLLLSTFYMHFYIEHNRGHHKNVSTPDDPASSRLGESIFAFWWRSVVFSYLSAWQLEFDRLGKLGNSRFSLSNQMLQFQMIQLLFAFSIWALFGSSVLAYYLLASLMGILLLETVNYIEHYGLQRTQVNDRYERVQPHHSWNSDHPVGRLMLFELSRHSDHHFIASRKYQVLRSFDDAPPMPTGYPGMMVLALVPPLWFAVMHRHMRKLGILKGGNVSIINRLLNND